MITPNLKVAETLGHPDVIRLFEQGLAMARAGKIVGVGIVALFDTGQPTASVGGLHPLSLYYGCDKLKQVLSQSIEAPASPILRARGN